MPVVSFFVFYDYYRASFTHLSYVVKKYAPRTDVFKDIVGNLVSTGIMLHEFLKHDLYRGKKEVLYSNWNTIAQKHKLKYIRNK